MENPTGCKQLPFQLELTYITLNDPPGFKPPELVVCVLLLLLLLLLSSSSLWLLLLSLVIVLTPRIINDLPCLVKSLLMVLEQKCPQNLIEL